MPPAHGWPFDPAAAAPRFIAFVAVARGEVATNRRAAAARYSLSFRDALADRPGAARVAEKLKQCRVVRFYSMRAATTLSHHASTSLHFVYQ